MNREVKFADGTAFPCGMCGESNGVLWILLDTDLSFVGIAEFLSDLKNTQTIKSYAVGYEEEAQVFEGYTGLTVVQKTTGGYQIALRKEGAA